MTATTMGEEANDGPRGTDTDRYAKFLADAPRWLHYEEARIDDLTRSEVNRLAREEIQRRQNDGCIEDEPRQIWAWLFVGYVLRDGIRADESGGEVDG